MCFCDVLHKNVKIKNSVAPSVITQPWTQSTLSCAVTCFSEGVCKCFFLSIYLSMPLKQFEWGDADNAVSAVIKNVLDFFGKHMYIWSTTAFMSEHYPAGTMLWNIMQVNRQSPHAVNSSLWRTKPSGTLGQITVYIFHLSWHILLKFKWLQYSVLKWGVKKNPLLTANANTQAKNITSTKCDI